MNHETTLGLVSSIAVSDNLLDRFRHKRSQVGVQFSDTLVPYYTSYGKPAEEMNRRYEINKYYACQKVFYGFLRRCLLFFLPGIIFSVIEKVCH